MPRPTTRPRHNPTSSNLLVALLVTSEMTLVTNEKLLVTSEMTGRQGKNSGGVFWFISVLVRVDQGFLGFVRVGPGRFRVGWGRFGFFRVR